MQRTYGKKRRRVLDSEEEWRAAALNYLERFEAPAARVKAVLAARARRQGGADDTVLRRIDAVVADLRQAGLIDDLRYARARVAALTARGKTGVAVRQDLLAKGLALDTVDAVMPDADADARRAAATLARRRKLGPYRSARAWMEWEGERRRREARELAVLARAGHDLKTARAVVRAPSIEALEGWCREGGA
ncbi:MAG: RecX family transcriptional regulator [Pseudomonadota bacterium]